MITGKVRNQLLWLKVVRYSKLESVTAGSVNAIDRRNMTSTYSLAVKACETLGGDDATFQNSIAQLHKWIGNTLLERIYEENRVGRCLPFRKTCWHSTTF